MSSKWILIIFPFLLCSCQKERFTREFKNGVQIIKYLNIDSWVPKFELQLTEEFTISGYQQGDEVIPFGDQSDLMIDEEDNIYYADRQVSKIHKFSKHGKYLKSVGREGRGPDESMALGGLFQYKNHLFLHSQSPSKLIKFTKDLDFVETVTLPQLRIMWIYRNQKNTPIFFMTLGQVEGIKNPYDFSWIRSYHTLMLPDFTQDTLASVLSPRSGEVKGGVYYLDYEIPKLYVMAKDSTLWLNQTVEYRIDLIHKTNLSKSIIIDLPVEKLTQAEQEEFQLDFEGRSYSTIMARAGLQSKIRKLPTYHQQIENIDNFDEEIWIFLRTPKTNKNQIVHVYNLEGDLKKQLFIPDTQIGKSNCRTIKENALYYVGGGDEEDVYVRKCLVEFVGMEGEK